MGLNFRKRVNLAGGLGLNISKSGFSISLRNKYGSIGPRGYSIRTGIPGLTFTSKGKKNKKKRDDDSSNLFIALFYHVPLLAIMTVGGVFWGIFKLLNFSYKAISNDFQYLSSYSKLRAISNTENKTS